MRGLEQVIKLVGKMVVIITSRICKMLRIIADAYSISLN